MAPWSDLKRTMRRFAVRFGSISKWPSTNQSQVFDHQPGSRPIQLQTSCVTGHVSYGVECVSPSTLRSVPGFL